MTAGFFCDGCGRISTDHGDDPVIADPDGHTWWTVQPPGEWVNVVDPDDGWDEDDPGTLTFVERPPVHFCQDSCFRAWVLKTLPPPAVKPKVAPRSAS